MLGARPASAEPEGAWPTVAPGGRPVLQQLATALEQRSALIVAALSQARTSCDDARGKGHGCQTAVLAPLTQLQAVAAGLDQLNAQLSERLGQKPPADDRADRQACSAGRDPSACQRVRADDEALDSFAQLRVAPALDSLGRIAEAASRALRDALNTQKTADARLPKNAPPKPAEPHLQEPARLQPERKADAPPPPPPRQSVQGCRAGKAALCLQVAGIHQARKEAAKAAEFMRLACRHGERSACPQK